MAGAQICENFYVREFDDRDHGEDEVATEGTGCYFFDLEEVREVFTNAGLEVLHLERTTREYKKGGKSRRDCSENSGAVNRTRVWIQGRFRNSCTRVET